MKDRIEFNDIMTTIVLLIMVALLSYLFVDSLSKENTHPTTGYTWIDVDGDGVEECIDCPGWEDSIKNPANEPYVIEVAFNLGIDPDEVTQEQFNQRYIRP